MLNSGIVEVTSFGEIFPKKENEARLPYDHQIDAIRCLDVINQGDSFSTLLVLPTGGGKTYTASSWLLVNAIDKKVKVLWIAHRGLLLDQAATSFKKFAYASHLPHITSFRYRIVSGSSEHDKAHEIKPNDDLLIAGKDSLIRNLDKLLPWLEGEDTIFMVVDEAHHATARSYRKVIDYVKEHIKHLKLLGLTATPYRTAKSEQGLLARIFTDGVKDGRLVKNDIGIAYHIDLKSLINRHILSQPSFESCYSEQMFADNLGASALEQINRFDSLPKDIAEKMATSAERNRLIVEHYCNNQEKYGKTIVFAIDILHAVQLNTLFNEHGIKSEYIVSGTTDASTGASISREENDRKIAAYEDGEVQVLININILTEGVDLPKTQTVFLARPTVSITLMTQMIGRALRGKSAGGTNDANIVSFIDNWNDRIAWVNPETIFNGNNDFADTPESRLRHQVSMISIAKIEEFAKMLDSTIDTSMLERIPFARRIPLGMYILTILVRKGNDEESDYIENQFQVMVYDSTYNAYQQMMESLPALFTEFDIDTDYPSDTQLEAMASACRNKFFNIEMIPPYDERDIVNVLRYFAQKGEAPDFYTFDQVSRDKVDVQKIAQHIYDRDMTIKAKSEFINFVWETSDNNILKLFFGRKNYFISQLNIELSKLTHPDVFTEEDNVKYGSKNIEDFPIIKIKEIAPDVAEQLTSKVYAKSKDRNGCYVCAHCGFKHTSRWYFQIDHIVPMSKGGKSVESNLQILCKNCNQKKGNKI